MKRVLLVVVALGITALWLVPRIAPEWVLGLAYRIERSAAGLELASVVVEGDTIAYLDGGSGEPLVLLHGFGADKDNWARVARHLTPYFRVLTPDLPPFGESEAAGLDAGAKFGVFDQVERVRRFAKALGLERFHLGGNSMGGTIAGAYAGRHPEDLHSLWLLAPGGVRAAEQSELEERLARGDNPLLVSTLEDFQELVEFTMVEAPFIPRSVLAHLAGVSIARRDLHQRVLHDLVEGNQSRAPPLEELLAESGVPTLITWGDRDRLLHVSGASVLAAAIPGAEIQILENVGHLPMIERPEQSAEALLAFLDRVDL